MTIALAMLGVAATAQASSYQCQPLTPMPGSVGAERAEQVRQSAGATYGAVNVLNEQVLQRMGDNSDFGVFIGDTSIFGVTSVPVHTGTDCPRDAELSYVQYDVNAVNFAVAGGSKQLKVFYSTSALMAYAPVGNFWRATMIGINAIGGTYWMLAAPFVGADDDTYDTSTYYALFNVNYDYIAGAELNLLGVQLGAGYVGSQGFYGHANSRKLSLFGRAVLSDELSRIPLAAAGLDRLPAAGMLTSAFARRTETGPADQGATALFDRDAEYTAHVAQAAIGGVLDVAAGLRIAPNIGFKEARVTVHQAATDAVLESRTVAPEQLSGVALGVVEVAAQRHLGVPATTRIQASARAALDVDGSLVLVELALNDDDVLAVFPYSNNSLLLRVSASIIGGEP